MARLLTLKPEPAPELLEHQAALCREWAAWCAREGLRYAETPADDPLLLNLLTRPQRAWAANFIARWDEAAEADARRPDNLATPEELAGVFLAVAREHSSRHEWRQVQRRDLGLRDYLDVRSVMALAFGRLHRVPVDGARTFEEASAERALRMAAGRLLEGWGLREDLVA